MPTSFSMTKFLQILWLLPLVVGESWDAILPKPSQNGDVVKCFSDIYNKFHEMYNTVAYEEGLEDTTKVLKTTLKGTTQIVALGGAAQSILQQHNTKFVVLLTSRVEDVENYLTTTSKSVEFKSNAGFLVVYLNTRQVNRIFEVAGRFHLQRIVVIDEEGNVYSTNGFMQSCGHRHEAVYLFNCTSIEYLTLFRIFYTKVVDLNGCTVRALALKRPPFVVKASKDVSPGLEPEILKVASEEFNFTIQYVHHELKHWGMKLSNGSFTDMIGALHNREVDVVFGNFRMNATLLVDFESGAFYIPSHMAFFVPSARQLRNWYAIVMVFDAELWCIVLVSAVFMSVVVYFFGTKARKPEGYDDLVHTSFVVLRLLLSETHRIPRFAMMRNLFLTWVLFCFIISNSYQNTLLSLIIKPIYEKQIDSIEDFLEEELQFGGSPSLRGLFSDHHNPISRKIFNHWTPCTAGLDCLLRTAKARDFAVMENSLLVRYYSKQLTNKNGRPLVYKLPTTIVYNSWMLYNKGHPLAKLQSPLITSLRENGLMYKWIDDYLPQKEYQPALKKAPLAMFQLMLTFYMLLVGSFISFLVFVAERMSLRQFFGDLLAIRRLRKEIQAGMDEMKLKQLYSNQRNRDFY